MARKRVIMYPLFVATCFLICLTWGNAETNVPVATLSANHSSSTSSSTTTTAKPSQECVCDAALLPRLGENGKELTICPGCKCKQVAHNTTLIKVVVIIVIWIISILVIYMLFLMCLDPLLNKRVKASNYQEHTNEDDDPTSSTPPLPSSGNQELNARANVLNLVGQQRKWKRQVREQRRHIYDRHTMLN